MQKKIIRLSLLLLIIFIIGVFFVSLNKSSFYNTKGLEGQELTDIKLKHFYTEKFITAEDLRKNNFTLINFWASWCGPCRLEHPFLLRLKNDKNLKVLGVNFKDKKDSAISFLSNYGNPYHELANDELGKYSINFGIYGIPESILINQDLKIIKKFIGPILEKDFIYIKDIIKK